VNGGRVDIETARRLAPNDAQVMVAQAFFEGMAHGEWARALRSFEAAESLGVPRAEDLRVKSAALVQLGRIEESIAVLERAAELDPANPSVRYMLATSYDMMRMPEQALRTLEVLRARSPRDPGVDGFEGGIVVAYTGNDAVALKQAESVLAN